MTPRSTVRCAIYTRVSTDQGLEQDFNSLDAQYDASQAYIRSQAHAGWTLLRAKYDDGGFSGGNTDRPALQRLLDDVRAGKIDVIVVYKVDRLTRSLADFAKLVELFDQHNVSFVSVTQQFNTTTSMGRLTLKVRTLKTGETAGGIPFTRGSLAHLLRNRFYIGEVAFKGEVLKGEQPAIVDKDFFEAVQAKLNDQVNNHKAKWTKSEGLLIGRLFDDRGNRMSPSHARKGSVKYRYYLSSALLQGTAERAGSVRRVPASEIETLVIKSVRDHLKPAQPIDDRGLVLTHVARVEVQPGRLVIQLAEPPSTLGVAWQKTPSRRRREILLPEGIRPEQARPIRSETRARLVASIARGCRWLDELIADPTASADSIAWREQCSVRKVNMIISLAFLAPDLVKAAIDGRLPHGMGVARLADLPAEWSKQHQMLGLPG